MKNRNIRIILVGLFAIVLAIVLSGHIAKAEPEKLEGLCFDPEDGTILNYYTDGKIDPSFTGFAQVSDKSTLEWFYVEKGKVTFSKNDIIQGTINGVTGWYLVRNSTMEPDTTVAQNAYGWWYVNNGKVDFSCDSVEENEYGWWRIRAGKVDFGFNGFAKNEHGWWYLEKGKVIFSKNDIISGNANTDPSAAGVNGWWYVRNGKVTKADTVAQNANGWWYVKDGKVDFSYNGFAKNENGWWYIEKGQVTFKKNDILKGIANTSSDKAGEDAWWYVRGSQVKDEETVAQNAHGWWYVKGGKVDFTYTGIKQNANGWWRIVNGKVDFNCNSVEQNEYGWWYLKNGKVDFSYSGLAQRGSEWWYVKGGKADFSYTGPAIYGTGGYHVINGILDNTFSGSYSGSTTYQVDKGRIISGWVIYNGAKYYFTGSGTMATETVTIGGRKEVFRMNGQWIDTSKMDTKAAGYGSSTNYLILVNTADKVTKIYWWNGSGWSVSQNYLCTIGNSSKGWNTVKGDFYVGYSPQYGSPYTRGYSFNDSDGHTLYYWTRFCDDFLFHSQLYDLYSYDLTTTGNALGEELSHGCVRLRIDNAKWIYDNIPDGTRVIVY